MKGSLVPQSNLGITVDVVEDHEDMGSLSSLSDDESSNSTGSSSSSSDFMEDGSSSSSSASLKDGIEESPLYEMSALLSQLPFKRGLSKHFDGKSQSFTSLCNVRSLSDLAKPERPLKKKKKLKACKSYGGGLDSHKTVLSPNVSSKGITKRVSRGSSFSSLTAAKRPPTIPTHRNSSQTLLFA